VLQYVAAGARTGLVCDHRRPVCCSVLQCVAVCCGASVLQCVAVCSSGCAYRVRVSSQKAYVLKCAAAGCSVLQCVALHCSVSVFQCVGVCCSRCNYRVSV